jgi:hypothetical protein
MRRSCDTEKFEVLTVKLWYQEMETRLWWCLEPAFDWSVEPDGRFCVGASGRNLASIAVKMF